MTDLRHRVDLAIAALGLHEYHDAARLVQEFTDPMKAAEAAATIASKALPCYWCRRDRAAVERMDMVEGVTVVGHDDNNGPVYYVECQACLARGPGHAYAVDALRQWNAAAHIAKIQPAATGDVAYPSSIAELTEEYRRAIAESKSGADDYWHRLYAERTAEVDRLRRRCEALESRPAAEREGEALSLLIECLHELVDEASDEHDSTHDLRKRIRALLSATPVVATGHQANAVVSSGTSAHETQAPQPAAPVEEPALSEARHELDLLQAVYGGWHARTPREVEIATALADTAPQDRDSPDNAISDLLTIIDGLRGIIWKQPAAPVEVSEETVGVALATFYDHAKDHEPPRICMRSAIVAFIEAQRALSAAYTAANTGR